MRCWIGVCHRHTETLLISDTCHILCPYTMGVLPPGFEVFCIRELRSTGTLFKCYFEGVVLCTSGLAGFYSLCSSAFT